MSRPANTFLFCGLILLVTAGCRTPIKQDQVLHASNQNFDLEFLKVMSPEFLARLEAPKQTAFSYLTLESADHDLNSKNSNRHYFHAAIFTVLSSPVVERPNYWVRLVNNTNRSDILRLYCFRAFFLRHIAPGDRLGKLAGIEGTDLWFNERTVRLVGGLGGKTRFEWKDGEDYVEIRMASELDDSRIPITLAVRGSRIEGENEYLEKTAEIIDLLRGRKENPNLVITGIAIY